MEGEQPHRHAGMCHYQTCTGIYWHVYREHPVIAVANVITDEVAFTDVAKAISIEVAFPVKMPELGRFGDDAGSIGLVPAQCWHITACL